DAYFGKARSYRRRNSIARFLDDDGHAEFFRQATDAFEAAAEITIATRLDHFLRGVHVEEEPFRVYEVHKLLNGFRWHLRRLDNTQVGEDGRCRSDAAELVRLAYGRVDLGFFDHSAL